MKVLIIGVGSIAKKHIKAIRTIEPQAEIFALRSSKDAIPYEHVKDIYEFEDIKAIDPDYIIVSNPTFKHFETIQKILPFDKPLFIEKPIFAELGHEEVIKEIAESKILTYVACDMRFLDCLTWLHQYMEEHRREVRINEINVYCGSYLPEWRPGTDFRKCYSAIPELGGGVHIDLIHDVDYVYWIFGNPQYHKAVFRNVSSLNIRAYDYANFYLEYPEYSANIVLNYYRRDAKRYMEILFDDCTWTVDMFKNEITSSNGELIYRSEQSGADEYEAQMRYFMHLVQLKATTSMNSAEEAYDVLKICLNNN
ncbi:MAG: Gfo/Idh/MocA family oxidoreductase [Bacteroidaceae bacterium]|nr:Gfo/Idh/MocA family oxidoreductase [Bacteroidaceae bacterium]